jgi:hypothetical protein
MSRNATRCMRTQIDWYVVCNVVCNIRRLQSKELVKAVLLSQLLLIAIQVKLRGVIPAELFQRSYSSGVISATRIE